MSNYYVKDNFLSDAHFKTINDYILKSSYKFKNHTVSPDVITENNFDYQFVKIIAHWDEVKNHYKGVPRDELNKIMPLYDLLGAKRILRCKVNCNPYSDKNHEIGWHKDVEDAPEDVWLSCLLYFTTCDGYTLLKTKDKTVKVDAVANRAFIFPSVWQHTGGSPTNVKARCVMNTIFEIDPKEKMSWMN